MRPRALFGKVCFLAWVLGATLAQAQDEALVEKINQVALTQEDLPPGWTLLQDRVDDPANFGEFSKLLSMISTLPETGSVNLGHGIQTPEGAFNVEYFAFARPEGVTTADPYFKDEAKKNNWLTFRLGTVSVLVLTNNRQAHEAIAQKKLLPFLEKLLAESIASEQAGKLGEAEQGYYAIVQTAPVYAKAWLRLGTIYQRANPPKNTVAMEAYQKAVAAHQSSPSLTDEELWQAKVGLGNTTLMEGQADVAIKVLEEARVLGGQLGGTQEAKSDYFLAVAYANKNDEDKFIEYLQAALDIEKSEGKTDLLQRARTDTSFKPYEDKKKFKKLLKKYGKN